MDLVASKAICSMFGMDDEEKIKSIADYHMAWIEEANQLSFEEFNQIDLRLR